MSKLSYLAVIAIVSGLLMGVSVYAQEPTAPSTDTAQTTPAATPATSEPPQKQKKPKENGGKKGKKSSAPAGGAPTAQCADGTYSHDKPTEDGKGGKAKVCSGHGGVSHFF